MHSVRVSLKNWWPLLPLMLIAILFRIGYVPLGRGTIDLPIYSVWSQAAVQHGLFSIYNHGPNYPPVILTVLYVIGAIQTARGLPITADEPGMFLMLKIVPVVAEVLTIGAVYAWLRYRLVWRWVIPVCLAISPGLIIISAWRGQTDSIVVMFMVLALIALNQDRPRLSWLFWAFAILTKTQAVFIGPLLFVLTLRRYGWRQLATCLGIGGGIYAATLAPFAIGSSFNAILGVYRAGTTNETTAHALNFWYLVNPISPEVLNSIPNDNLVLWGPLTAQYAGYIMAGALMLLILIHAWHNSGKEYEFVWAAGLDFASLIFLTRIFERYLYYAGALFPIAVVQEPQIWGVALGVTYTFALSNITIWTGRSYSNLGDWFGWFLWLRKVYPLAAALNVGMTFETIRILGSGRGPYKYFFRIVRFATIVTAVLLVYFIFREPLSYYPTAKWLSDHVANSTRIATENLEVTHYANDLNPAPGAWDWRLTPRIEIQGIRGWQASGVQYVIVDQWVTPDEEFTTRVNRLVDQGGTLLYESNSLLRLNSRQAILWTFRPQKLTDLVYDDSLRLIGYDLVADKNGEAALFYWYVEQTTPTDFNLFVHLTDPTTGQLVGQADTALGQGIHPTSTWRLHEVVSERYMLPNLPDNRRYTLQVGLYQLSTGRRALMKDRSGHDQGDHIEIPISRG